MDQEASLVQLAQSAATALEGGHWSEGADRAEAVVRAAPEKLAGAGLIDRIEAIERLLQAARVAGDALFGEELELRDDDFELTPPSYRVRQRVQRVASELHTVLRPAYETLLSVEVAR